MTKVIVKIFIALILLFNFASAQDISSDDKIKTERANEIVNLARKAVFKNIKADNLKSIQVKKISNGVSKTTKHVEERDDLVTSSESITEVSLSLEFPKRIKNTSISYKPGANASQDYTKLETVSDGDDYERSMDIIRGGKRIDLGGLAARLPSSIPSPVKGQLTDVNNQMNKTGQNADLSGLLTEVFPVLLNTPWDSSLSFTYIGKAVAGETKADIIQIKSIEKEQIRLFFDENTHLLLMMTVTSNETAKTKEDKYFFSNYELINGLMVAKKINYESLSVNKEKLAVSGLPTLLESSKKTTTETTIKEFKVNPNLPTDFFAVKK